jgi:TetR/AcrR family transcriptional regulator, cholesterol catabolism regulator
MMETVRQAMTPATPATPAQHDRYERLLQAATAMLALGGEEMLQTKELAQRAEVSLATLYRYFPSKDHVLLAISYSRYENALRRVTNEAPHGATVRERVTSHLLREFRAEQRDQKLTAALTRVITDTRREYSQLVRQIQELHIQVLRQVAVAGGPISDEQDRRLRIVADVFGAATRRWLAGVSSAAEARFEIRIGCHLLNTADLFPSGNPADDAVARGALADARALRSRPM